MGEDLGGGDPVFVDRSGRRRRLVTIVGAAAGTALAVACLVLVAGLTGSSPVPLPGFPGGGQGRPDPAGVVLLPAVGPTPVAAATTPARRPSPSPSRTGTPPTSGATTPSPSAPASSPPAGNRRTSHPGNPKASRTR